MHVVVAQPEMMPDLVDRDMRDQIVELWNDEKGINVDDYFVESEDDVPISMLRIYTRLDFDSYTIRGDEAGDQPLSIAI